ncbi:MAG TPA: hypothetical protein VLM75_07810 [Spirochaetota bacterium]|nr:hypothetical protein [Spirochaetota bacterium]
MTAKMFKHPKIGEDIGSISGHYSFLREAVIVYRDRELLYYTGFAVTDSACCGTGACVFCRVAGFIRARHPGNDGQTEVDPVTDTVERKEIEDILKEKEGCTQVNYF